MVKYRLITTYRNFEHVKKVLDHYKLKWEVFMIMGTHHFVFRCGDKRYKDILTLATTRMDGTGVDPEPTKTPKKKKPVKKNRAFHYA